MRIKKLFFAIFTFCATGILFMGCGNTNQYPREESVSKDLKIAIFESTDTDRGVVPVKPALLEENISLDKIIHYDRDGDFITVPFHFKDSVEYARITAANIGKRIVITADGVIVSTPMVKMRIGDGACSFMLSKEQAQKLFPKEKIERLLSGSN